MTEKTKAEFQAAIAEKTDDQLRAKLQLGDVLCAMLKQDTDARAPAAIARLRQQQRWIMEVQAERKRAERVRRGEPKPEPVAIGMEALRLFGRAPGVDD